MNEEEKLALIQLTQEQKEKLDAFISAFYALQESGVCLLYSEYELYAVNVNNFEAFDIDWRVVSEKEAAEGWVDEFPYWRTEHSIIPSFFSHMSDDDAFRGKVKGRKLDRNLFKSL